MVFSLPPRILALIAVTAGRRRLVAAVNFRTLAFV